MADQYWRTPKKIDNRSVPHMPRGHWYASPRGSIEIYTPSGVPIGKINAAALREFLNMLDRHNPRNAVPDLHPEVLKMIEAGPQSICDHYVEHIPVMRNESLEEFARRIALRAVELEREDVDAILCALITNDELARMKDRLEAIRRRGKP